MVTPLELPRESPRDRLAREAHVNVVVLANRCADAMEQVCRTEGISMAQYVALWVLCLAPDAERGIPMGEVADGLLNRAADTTRLVDRLERAGLVERRRNPDDRRGVLVRATREGRAVFTRLAPRMRELHRTQWGDLTATELETLHVLLGRALLAAEAVAGEAPAAR